MFKRVAAVCVVLLSMAVPAAAQEKPYSFMAGGVLMAPLSNSADRFSMGLGFTGGFAWRFTSQLSLTADYLWSALGVQEGSAANGASRPAEVTPRIQFGTVNIKFQGCPGPRPAASPGRRGHLPSIRRAQRERQREHLRV